MLRMRLTETNATMASRTMIRPKLKARRVLILSLDIGNPSSATCGKRPAACVRAPARRLGALRHDADAVVFSYRELARQVRGRGCVFPVGGRHGDPPGGVFLRGRAAWHGPILLFSVGR